MSNVEHLAPFDLLCRYITQAQERQQLVDNYRDEQQSYLAFSAGRGRFLLSIQDVLEVTITLTDITPLPFVPKWLLGLSSSRGDVFSVVDFKAFVDASDTTKAPKVPSYIFLRGEGAGYVLKVDEVWGSRACDLSEDIPSQRGECKWIDGRAELGNQIWEHIDLSSLVSDAVFIQSY